jgi:hypothetical protein
MKGRGSSTSAFSAGLGTPLGSRPRVPLPQENALVRKERPLQHKRLDKISETKEDEK